MLGGATAIVFWYKTFLVPSNFYNTYFLLFAKQKSDRALYSKSKVTRCWCCKLSSLDGSTDAFWYLQCKFIRGKFSLRNGLLYTYLVNHRNALQKSFLYSYCSTVEASGYKVSLFLSLVCPPSLSVVHVGCARTGRELSRGMQSSRSVWLPGHSHDRVGMTLHKFHHSLFPMTEELWVFKCVWGCEWPWRNTQS